MAKPVASRGTDQFVVRFPEGMRDKIKAIADREGRSMNSQIIHMLDHYVNDYEAHDIPEEYISDISVKYINVDNELLTKALKKLHIDMGDSLTRVFKELYQDIRFENKILSYTKEKPSPNDDENDTKEK